MDQKNSASLETCDACGTPQSTTADHESLHVVVGRDTRVAPVGVHRRLRVVNLEPRASDPPLKVMKEKKETKKDKKSKRTFSSLSSVVSLFSVG